MTKAVSIAPGRWLPPYDPDPYGALHDDNSLLHPVYLTIGRQAANHSAGEPVDD